MMFTALFVLHILLEIPAIIFAKERTSCPVIDRESVQQKCSLRIEHACGSDGDCFSGTKCCPSSRDGGCSLGCVKPRVLEGCPVPIDFAMIVDASGSISRRNFKRLLEFVEDMLDGFDISEEGTHIAVIEYSTSASVQIRFNDFSGGFLNAANLKRKIRRIPHTRGYTYIDKALQLANTDVFSVKDGMRPNVTKVALVMTDGQQTIQNSSDLSSDVLSAAVQPLKDKNVHVISLGIGSNTNLFDLLTMASSDNDVYLAENFDVLKELAANLTQNKCPVNGNWSDWGEYSSCSVPCGGGIQTRFRECDNPPPAYGGKDCLGESEDIRQCNDFPCPVHGGWTEWKPWDECPVICGGGIQSRSRNCSNPPPANGGNDCEGEGLVSRSCNESPCPEDGNWSAWNDFTPCSVTCGGGTKNRSRTCTNPPPKFSGKDCVGESQDIQPCNNFPCPVDGRWSDWGLWGSCSLTCGGGIQDRLRTCTNPPPAFGGSQCSGPNVETIFCQQEPCPVPGGFTAWRRWSICSASCGGGMQKRTRTCTNPPPAHGGEDCEGDREEVQPCNERPCPVDGNWTDWGFWSRCDKKCGGGRQGRSRTCTNPPAAYGGAQCTGTSTETRSCNNLPCPGDGSWTPWKPWGACSLSCAGGVKRRLRTCTNPPPTFGGKYCKGNDEETQSCNTFPCPVDGNWTEWRPWRRCPVTCGGAFQDRSRSCTNPPPAFGGANCVGEGREFRQCNKNPCPVDGSWARWKAWSSCSVTCGGGTQRRTRDCSFPPPTHGGKNCPGSNKDERSCNTRPCPVNGNWSAWRAWTPCSRTCGGGTQTRVRFCTNPRPAYGGNPCVGADRETQSCNEDPPCPVPGGWAQWSRWDACTVTCGTGVQRRFRTCTSPPPSNGGARCFGQDQQIYYCYRGSCPVDGQWSRWERWGRCSRTCNGGVKRRYRTCSKPRPSNGGKYCSGENMEEIKCNANPCAVNGNWGPWDSWSACSRTCGGRGRMTRTRKCNNPPPANGGRYCDGSSTAMVVCNTKSCGVKKCKIPMDFAILVDTSGSISRRDFRTLLRFVRSIVSSFEITDEMTHIALIEYSTTASVQLRFNELNGRDLNRWSVESKIDGIPHRRGFTYIDRALSKADEEVFTYEAGMRNYVKKVALVVTDGEQTKGDKSVESVNEMLANAAKPLKDKGVKIISLGIGKKVNKENLEAISSGDFVFRASSFNSLRRMVSDLRKGTCLVTAAGYKYPRYQR